MKQIKKLLFSTFTLLLLLCLFVPEAQAKENTPRKVAYSTGTNISLKKKTIEIGSSTKVLVKLNANDKNYKDRKLISVTYKNKTPKIISVNKKGTITGKKSGTGKVTVTVIYKAKVKYMTKCISGKQKVCWKTETLKEVKTLKVNVVKKSLENTVEDSVIHILGGSIHLYFEVDGKAYGNPVTVGVGIYPLIDYKDSFPVDPVKEGYLFDGWYGSNGVKIGTTAQSIYPVYDKVYSGETATVHAEWIKIK